MRRHRLGDRIWIVPGGGQTEEAGARAARVLVDQGLPSAVVAFNDRCAVGLLDAFVRRGIDVPGSISIVGFDDSTLSRLAHVNLTTVSQDTEQQAKYAVAAAIERLDHGRAGGSEVVLPPRLVIRNTTAPAPVTG